MRRNIILRDSLFTSHPASPHTQDRLIKHITSHWHLTNGFLRLFFKVRR